MEGVIEKSDIRVCSCLDELFSECILVLSIHGENRVKNGVPESGMKNRGY